MSSGYIRAVSGEQLDKHVPEATVTHATEETECCLRGPRRELEQPSQLIIGSHFCTRLDHGSGGIAIINIRYHETSSENTAEE
jgi:hypothetical protein